MDKTLWGKRELTHGHLRNIALYIIIFVQTFILTITLPSSYSLLY